jgi:hypothetical protein
MNANTPVLQSCFSDVTEYQTLMMHEQPDFIEEKCLLHPIIPDLWIFGDTRCSG